MKHVNLRSQLIIATCGIALAVSNVLPGKANALPSKGGGSPLSQALPASVDNLEAQDLMNLQAPLLTMISDISKQFPEDYTDGRVGTSDNPVAPMVAFKAKAPRAALRMLASLKVPVEVRENLGFNKIEMQGALTGATQALSGMFPKGLSVSGGSEDIGGINVHAPISKAARSALGAIGTPAVSPVEVERRIRGSVAMPRGTRLTVTDSTLGGAEAANWGPTGGTPIWGNPGSSGFYAICTTAFTAKSNSSADLGPLTAQHCAVNAKKYSGGSPNFWHVSNGRRAFELQYRRGVFNISGDAAFYRSPVMEDAIFQSDWNKFTPVHTWANSVRGSTVCRFGQTTGTGCSRIIDTNFCVTDGDTKVQLCGMVRTDRTTSKPGDSGGPFFANSTALGVLYGWADAGGDVYTGLSHALYQTGTSLCTNYPPYPKCS